jgi:hypothetical protein
VTRVTGECDRSHAAASKEILKSCSKSPASQCRIALLDEMTMQNQLRLH